MSNLAPNAPLPAEPAESLTFGGYGGLAGAVQGVGFWPRAAARVIDMVLHYLIGFCSGLFIAIVIVIATGGRGSPFLAAKMRSAGLLAFVLALLGSVAYHTICESLHGSTVGKLLFSMVVVQEDGSPCGFRSALIRSFAYFVDALFFGLIGYFAMQKTPQEQRHGDEWAHTIVCKRSVVSPEKLRGGGRFVGALLLAAFVDATLVITGLVLKLVY